MTECKICEKAYNPTGLCEEIVSVDKPFIKVMHKITHFGDKTMLPSLPSRRILGKLDWPAVSH